MAGMTAISDGCQRLHRLPVTSGACLNGRIPCAECLGNPVVATPERFEHDLSPDKFRKRFFASPHKCPCWPVSLILEFVKIMNPNDRQIIEQTEIKKSDKPTDVMRRWLDEMECK